MSQNLPSAAVVIGALRVIMCIALDSKAPPAKYRKKVAISRIHFHPVYVFKHDLLMSQEQFKAIVLFFSTSPMHVQ